MGIGSVDCRWVEIEKGSGSMENELDKLMIYNHSQTEIVDIIMSG